MTAATTATTPRHTVLQITSLFRRITGYLHDQDVCRLAATNSDFMKALLSTFPARQIKILRAINLEHWRCRQHSWATRSYRAILNNASRFVRLALAEQQRVTEVPSAVRGVCHGVPKEAYAEACARIVGLLQLSVKYFTCRSREAVAEIIRGRGKLGIATTLTRLWRSPVMRTYLVSHEHDLDEMQQLFAAVVETLSRCERWWAQADCDYHLGFYRINLLKRRRRDLHRNAVRFKRTLKRRRIEPATPTYVGEFLHGDGDDCGNGWLTKLGGQHMLDEKLMRVAGVAEEECLSPQRRATRQAR